MIEKVWLDKKYQCKGLKSIIKVTSDVIEKATSKETSETRWYISSLGLNAKEALDSVRSHWQVESMQWVLDMTFRDDESRIRKAQGPLVFNVMRKMGWHFSSKMSRNEPVWRPKRKCQG